MSYFIGAETVLPCTASGAILQRAYVEVDGASIVGIGGIDSLTAGQRSALTYYENATLIPGLINAHEHLVTKSKYTPWTLDTVKNEPIAFQTLRATRNAQGLLRDGVTTIRECGCRERTNISIAKAVRDGLVQGPDVLACGKPISMIGGHCYYYSYEVGSPAEVVAAVRTELKNGADFIKVHATGGAGTLEGSPKYAQLSYEELKAAADEAHKEDKRVCSHAIGRKGIENTILAGIDTVEHGQYLDEELLELMCARGTYYVPTLTGYIPLARDGLKLGRPAWMVEKARVLLDEHQRVMQLVKKYPEIVIGAGTDSTGEMSDEIAELIATGYGNYEGLMMATLGSARVLGIEERVGTLAVGKKADIAIADGNLLGDIGGLKRIKRVLKAGRDVRLDE
jgi:imidazolonepropionase-like amidohydrolase